MRLCVARAIVTALLCCSGATASHAAAAVVHHDAIQARGQHTANTDISSQRRTHHRRILRRRYAEPYIPAYYARPRDYRPYAIVPLPFGFSYRYRP